MPGGHQLPLSDSDEAVAEDLAFCVRRTVEPL